MLILIETFATRLRIHWNAFFLVVVTRKRRIAHIMYNNMVVNEVEERFMIQKILN